MDTSLASTIDVLRTRVRHMPAVQRVGTVTGVAGLIMSRRAPMWASASCAL